MNTGTNRSGFPQWTFKENSFFDKIAVWIDKTFYGFPYNLTTEKLLIFALCTNVFGLHRVYAGRKISAVVGWLLLLCSLIAREYLLWFILPWFLIELIRICRGNYGRLKSNQAFNFHKFKAIVGYKARAKSKAVSSCISVVMAGLILAFVPPAQTVTPDPDITSNYPIIVSQADFAVTTNSTESQVTDDSTTSSTLLTESTAMPELTT